MFGRATITLGIGPHSSWIILQEQIMSLMPMSKIKSDIEFLQYEQNCLKVCHVGLLRIDAAYCSPAVDILKATQQE